LFASELPIIAVYPRLKYSFTLKELLSFRDQMKPARRASVRPSDFSSYFRIAASAKCLFETMREQRDQVRRAYVTPLKDKIEALRKALLGDRGLDSHGRIEGAGYGVPHGP
jgi:hypothetical protein